MGNMDLEQSLIGKEKGAEGRDEHSLSKILEHSQSITEYKKVSDRDGEDLANKLRMESFNSFSPKMKEALSHISDIFKGVDGPWAIHGSTALVLEAETAKKPVDIDIAFADVDYEKIYAKFKSLKEEGVVEVGGKKVGIVSELEPIKLTNEDGSPNGCTRIYAKVRVGSGKENDPYEFVEVEAFSQNIDPSMPKNGLTNPGYDKMTIMRYEEQEGESNLELNFASREENFKFYLQIAAAELQKYHLDNALKEGGMKNKFPQRLNNILAIIKRREREELIKEGKFGVDDEFKFENVTDANIAEIANEFSLHNADINSIKHTSTVENRLSPVMVLFTKLSEFKQSKTDGLGAHEGFVGQRGREGALDDLTQENLTDMKGLSDMYKKLESNKKEFEELATKCVDGCIEPLEKLLIEKRQVIVASVEESIVEINKVKEKYEEYLGKINYKDNRDFIPYISIKETLDSYIAPSLETALKLQQEVHGIQVK